MNKKMSKRQRDIKTKLMAAICMLLVSSIMMVSTTYAWFTLSTAPEVTGIQTAVGANGNLEMALLNPTLQGTDNKLVANWGDQITSGESDSMDAAGKLISEANITWGNLVDVSDYLTYGLNNITLYPSNLTYNGAGHEELASNPLARPVYGADGRVAELKSDTLTASFASGTFSNEGKFGVRAVGTASSMTARELAHRAALTNAANASTDAKSYASNSLKANGNVLAAMAIAHVGGTNTFSATEEAALRAIVNAVDSAHDKIEEALVWYVVAENIAPASQNDSTYMGIQTEILKLDLAGIQASEFTKPDGFDAAVTALTTSRGQVTNALSVLDAAKASGTYTWDALAGALNAIMDYNKMLLCDLSMEEVTKQENGQYVNAGKIAAAYADGGLRLQMRPGSGVFADIADFCGTYSAEITFPDGTSVMNIPIGGWTATMTTDKPINPTYLTGIRNNGAKFANAAGGESTNSITDFYGYIIDLAFRTNASNSNLLLQAEGIDRIYGEEGKNESTLGGGSTMTFTATDSFGVTKVSALMGSIRIVFFEPDTSKIIGYAQLNPATSEIVGNSVTMKMAMCNMNGAFIEGEPKVANVITALNQNEAKAVSVLVYLDGTTITNKDVAATGSQSMVGTMNLQFASSAELQAMNYADLKDGKSSGEGSSTFDLTAVKVDAATAQAGYSVSKAMGGTYSVGKGFGIVLNKVPAAGEAVTAKVGSDTVTGVPTVVGGMNGYVFLYDGTLAADTVIEITVGTGSGTGNEEEEEPVTPTTYTVTINGEAAAAATAGQDYTITLPDGHTLTKVEVGGTDITTSVVENKIPAASVTGNIVITTTQG